MRDEQIEFYRQAWEHANFQPAVSGPSDFTYQSMGRYVRAISCSASSPFAIPVGITAKVTGIDQRFVGHYIRELVRHGILRVERPGKEGVYTRYAFAEPRPRHAWQVMNLRVQRRGIPSSTAA